jgi:hypothetical protein
MDRVPHLSESASSPDFTAEAADLTRRLRISGLPHLLVDRLLGRTRVGSLFLAIDGRTDSLVTVKVIDDDLVYDVGAADFLRGLGDARETWTPHVLNPGRAADGRGALCYISRFVPGQTLREALERAEPLTDTEVFRIAAELAGAAGYWHAQDEAHGELGPDSVLLQSGQVVVVPPGQPLYGAQACRQDVCAVACLALALWDRTAPTPGSSARFASVLDTLRASADPDQPTLLSMSQLSELLRRAGEESARRPRLGILSRWFGRS